jgi:hypothetical protein
LAEFALPVLLPFRAKRGWDVFRARSGLLSQMQCEGKNYLPHREYLPFPTTRSTIFFLVCRLASEARPARMAAPVRTLPRSIRQ